ncbi:MAG TPA: hypothetical protein ENK02_06405 [Planctomycetes bacterium]|nr:hypothetical protein [Planctomycetota bacterium]
MKPRAATPPSLLLAWTLLLLGCLSVNWVRQHQDEPPPRAAMERLQPRQTDLDHCLAALGAPLLVQRGPGGSTELLWAHTDRGGWGFSISLNLFRFVNPSFSYQGTDGAAQALRLRFDEGWQLIQKSEGSLASLRRAQRERD